MIQRTFAVLALASVILSACSPAQTPTASIAPSAIACLVAGTGPAPSAKPEPPRPPPVQLIGWWQDRLLATIGDVVCSFDLAGDGWEAVPVPAAGYVTDGTSLAAKADDGSLLHIGPNGTSSRIDLSGRPWLETWRFQGSLVPLARGGYMLAGLPAVVELSTDGSLVERGAVPAGTVAIGGGGVPGLVAISRVREDMPLSVPDNVALWRVSDQQSLVSLEATHGPIVERMEGGTYARAAGDGSWRALLPDGTVSVVSPPLDAVSRVDPTGTLVFVEPSEVGDCRTDMPGGCGVEVRQAVDLSRIAAGPGPADVPEWQGDTLAYLWRRPNEVLPVLIVLTPTETRQIALP